MSHRSLGVWPSDEPVRVGLNNMINLWLQRKAKTGDVQLFVTKVYANSNVNFCNKIKFLKKKLPNKTDR